MNVANDDHLETPSSITLPEGVKVKKENFEDSCDTTTLESNDKEDAQEEEEDEDSAEKDESVLVNGITCSVCKKVYYSRPLLQHHCNKEHGITIYICPVCKKTFRQVKYLRLHIRIAHRREYEFWCKKIGIDPKLNVGAPKVTTDSLVVIEDGDQAMRYQYDVRDLEQDVQRKAHVPMAVKHTGIEMRIGKGKGWSKKYSDPISDEDSDSMSAVPVKRSMAKRGRGRQRKYPTSDDESDYMSKTSESSLQRSGKWARRGRGRGRKVDEDSDYTPGLSSQRLHKGKRGRPRKYPLPTSDDESDYVRKPTLPQGGLQRGKRGRPRKYPRQDEDSDYLNDMIKFPRKLPTIRRARTSESPENERFEARQHAYRSVTF